MNLFVLCYHTGGKHSPKSIVFKKKKKKKLLWNVMDKVGQKVGENLLMSSTWLRLYRSLRKILRSIF